MNSILTLFAREYIKSGLARLSEKQQLIFKRMYSHRDLGLPINFVVDAMPDEKLDWAMQQVKNSLEKGEAQ